MSQACMSRAANRCVATDRRLSKTAFIDPYNDVALSRPEGWIWDFPSRVLVI